MVSLCREPSVLTQTLQSWLPHEPSSISDDGHHLSLGSLGDSDRHPC